MYNWLVKLRNDSVVNVVAKNVDIVDGQLVFRDEQGMICKGFNQTHWLDFSRGLKAEH
jgi:hypothetical protein